MANSPIDKALASALWPHQLAAARKAFAYTAASAAGTTRGAGLVQMPTGTGKSGVIAALARSKQFRCVLLVVPRVALRDQLAKDVDYRFFRRIAVDETSYPHRVRRLIGNVPADVDDLVLVTTIQKLQSIQSRDTAAWQRLAAAADLVVFDEGHYEPSPVWRELIRSFPCARVLFTATPFRNDLKLFDVDYAHAFAFSFSEALENRFVRSPDFIRRAGTTSPNAFMADVIDFYQSTFGAMDATTARVIIRCDDAASIRQLAVAAGGLGWSYVAIHDRFDSVGGNEYKNVPDPDTTDAAIWIHQGKLLEGIDDPRFRILAIYEGLGNVRSVVQQIGRILRNPGRAGGENAYVLDYSGDTTEAWRNYRAYDDELRASGLDFLRVGADEFVRQILRTLPPFMYLDGKFRRPVSRDGALDVHADVVLPRIANIYLKPAGFTLGGARDALVATFEERDRFVAGTLLDTSTLAIAYTKAENTRFLANSAFLEPSFGVTLVHATPNYVFFYDAHGSQPPEALNLGTPVPAKQLKRLFTKAPGTKLTSVSLENANVSPTAVRTRAFSASDVAATVELFDDHQYVCRTVTGYSTRLTASGSEERAKRYVGFASARVSDQDPRYVPIDDYVSWADDVAAKLQSQKQPLTAFARYAVATAVPADTTPLHILLETDTIASAFLATGEEGLKKDDALDLEDAGSDVDSAGGFTVIANGISVPATVQFDAAHARYTITSPALDRMYYRKMKERGSSSGVVGTLNATQAFRIVLAGRRIYAVGAFHEPKPNLTRVLDLLHPVTALAAAASEKGKTCTSTGWEKGSIFAIIDNRGKKTEIAPFLNDIDLLVCDDLGDESADFIALRKKASSALARVIYIHAKAATQGSKASASSLQVVAKQAEKNLGEIMPFASQRPGRATKWAKPWKVTSIGTVAKRVRLSSMTAAAAWDLVRNTVEDPLAEREVWIVLGNTLSAAALAKNLSKDNAAAVQAAYLLHSTLSTVGAAGARLRVFCSP